MIIDMDAIAGLKAYQWLASTVVPRPVAWVSTLSREGVGNLAPFSFFQVLTGTPPTVMISPLHMNDGSLKDTTRNIIDTQEFVISLVPHTMVDAMNETSPSFAHGLNEFEHVGIESMPSLHVKPPRVLKSPVSLECQAVQIQPYPPEQPSCHLILGRVLTMHIDEAVLDPQGQVDPAKLDLVSRMGGAWYGRTQSDANFTLSRPKGWDQRKG